MSMYDNIAEKYNHQAKNVRYIDERHHPLSARKGLAYASS
jgi:hypothetical protein